MKHVCDSTRLRENHTAIQRPVATTLADLIEQLELPRFRRTAEYG